MAEINIEKMGKRVAEEALDGYIYKGKTLREWIDILAQTQWIPVKYRQMTEEEKKYYEEYSDCDLTEMFDCPMPDDGQEVLVSTKWGVDKDTFCIDGYGMYFENYDADDLLAWMSLPAPFEPQESEG